MNLNRTQLLNETVGNQNRLLMDIMNKRNSFGASNSSPAKDFNATMITADRTKSQVDRSSRNSGLQTPAPNTTLDFDTPIKRTQSQIKRSQVRRAAYPNAIGLTPVPTKPDDEFFGTSSHKKGLDIRERTIGSAFVLPRNLDSPDRRRMNPLEYRGPNLSDCMYHTMTGFKEDGARKN